MSHETQPHGWGILQSQEVLPCGGPPPKLAHSALAGFCPSQAEDGGPRFPGCWLRPPRFLATWTYAQGSSQHSNQLPSKWADKRKGKHSLSITQSWMWNLSLLLNSILQNSSGKSVSARTLRRRALHKGLSTGRWDHLRGCLPQLHSAMSPSPKSNHY